MDIKSFFNRFSSNFFDLFYDDTLPIIYALLPNMEKLCDLPLRITKVKSQSQVYFLILRQLLNCFIQLDVVNLVNPGKKAVLYIVVI